MIERKPDPVVTRFTPVKDFSHAGSEYCAGLNYSVRASNTALAELVRGWLGEKKVVEVKVSKIASGFASITGRLTVSAGQKGAAP